MKKITLSLLTLSLSSIMLHAQVGIGTTNPNENSVLEIYSPDKGVLMPRVALTDINSPAPLSAHVAGMTVYNTATAGTVPNQVIPGFYVNDGTKWIRTYSTDGSVDAKWVNNVLGRVELQNLSDGTSVRPVGTEFVALDNGNVGIGTSNATDRLTVDIGTYDGTGITITGGENAKKALNFAEIGNNSQGEINWRKTGLDAAVAASIRSVGTDGYSNRGIGFFTGDYEDYENNALERMRLTSSGRLGIGTTTPDSRVQIAYDPALEGLNVEGIRFDVDASLNGLIKYGNDLTISNSGAQHPLNLVATNGRININSGGTTDSGVELQTGSVVRLSVNVLNGGLYDGVSILDNASSQTKFTADGKVGIGTDQPKEKLVVKGAIKVEDGGYGTLTDGDTSPTPTGGAGTVVFSNGHFFGWDGSNWKQLDN